MYTKPLSFLFGYISDKLTDKDTKTNWFDVESQFAAQRMVRFNF
jgi:hypothetical protein